MGAAAPLEALDSARAEIEELEREVESLRVQLETEREGCQAEICVRQSELDDIAEIVGVQKDAPYAAVRDRVAELARAGDQLRMAT